MGEHSKPDDGSNGAHAADNGTDFTHKLPKWFARRGPRPYWLAEHWSLILAVLTAIAVFVNTVVFPNLPNARASEWVNAGLAWLATLALYLKDQQGTINRVAAWREKVRGGAEQKTTE